jgi:hypothetical protein
MGHDLSFVGLSFVGEAGNGCQIYRETSGRYVVSHQERPQHKRWVATLASAYACCNGFLHPRTIEKRTIEKR